MSYRLRLATQAAPLRNLIALAALPMLQVLAPAAAVGQTASQTPPQTATPAPASGQSAPRLAPIAGAEGLPEIVARVDGDPVTRGELLAQAQGMRRQALQGGGDSGQSEQFLILVLDALVNERLVHADSQARGIGPPAAEIDQRVQAVIEAYGGEQEFEKALQAQELDRQYVRRQVTQTLSFDKVLETEIKPAIQIGDEAIQSYYDRSQEQMKAPATYKVRHIMKQVPETAGFEARDAARSQLEALRQQVVAGADLAALAREHSDDPRTREQGGELPWLALTGQSGGFDPAVAALEVGELSGVVETPVGLHLIRLEDRKPERIRPLDEVRQEIANRLAALEAREEVQRRAERLRGAAKVEVLIAAPATE